MKKFFTKLQTKLISLIVMISTISCFTAMPVFAADSEDASTALTVDASGTRGGGDLLTSGATVMTGGSADVYVTLAWINFNCDAMASVASSSATGTVSCTMFTPDGDMYYLGAVPASGGTTNTKNIFFANTGTYRFHFDADTAATLYVSGYLFD